MATPAPRFAQLSAPPGWRSADFISDLHLQASDGATFTAWQGYMQRVPADALFILGDLFEVWVGDDVLQDTSTFEHRCAEVLRATAGRIPVFFMHGNRDFLAGQGLMEHAGMRLLDDPTVLDMLGQRLLLSHGDALCLADTDYLRFREQVRGAQWQSDFLSKPLAQRQQFARGVRDASEARKRSTDHYADVDAQAARDWLRAADAPLLLHGHTHRPAAHELGDGLRRIVLSDWDAMAQPPRMEVMRLDQAGLHRLGIGQAV